MHLHSLYNNTCNVMAFAVRAARLAFTLDSILRKELVIFFISKNCIRNQRLKSNYSQKSTTKVICLTLVYDSEAIIFYSNGKEACLIGENMQSITSLDICAKCLLTHGQYYDPVLLLIVFF